MSIKGEGVVFEVQGWMEEESFLSWEVKANMEGEKERKKSEMNNLVTIAFWLLECAWAGPVQKLLHIPP